MLSRKTRRWRRQTRSCCLGPVGARCESAVDATLVGIRAATAGTRFLQRRNERPQVPAQLAFARVRFRGGPRCAPRIMSSFLDKRRVFSRSGHSALRGPGRGAHGRSGAGGDCDATGVNERRRVIPDATAAGNVGLSGTRFVAAAGGDVSKGRGALGSGASVDMKGWRRAIPDATAASIVGLSGRSFDVVARGDTALVEFASVERNGARPVTDVIGRAGPVPKECDMHGVWNSIDDWHVSSVFHTSML